MHVYIIFIFYSTCSKNHFRIVNDSDGLPLPGASIVEKGTNNGVTSDFDGNYSIEASEGSVLVFSFVGYTSQEITVEVDDTINVSLESGTELEEVVLTALGLEKKKTMT